MRDRILRLAAIVLVVYGLFGFGLLALGFVVANQTFGELERLRASLDGQRDSLVGVLRSTATSMDEAATTLTNFETTLAEARASAEQGARVARETSQSMAGLSAAMNIQFLGLQPLAPLAGGFADTSRQLEDLSVELDDTAAALGQNRGDLSRTSASIQGMRRQVAAVASEFARTPLLGGPAESLRPFKLAIYGLLIWLAGQALLSILFGVALFRYSHLRLRAARRSQPSLDAPRSTAMERRESDDLSRIS